MTDVTGYMNYTVCLPTLNAAKTWPAVECALKAQIVQPQQVIVIDSESTDDTAQLVRRAGFSLVSIARKDFRHGATRQIAADIASDSEFVVYLTQDALLASHDAISVLLRAFENPEVGAAYGRQLPRHGAKPIETHARLFNYPPVSDLRSAESIATLGFKTIFFSNSFGAYRRSALQTVGGFPLDANFGEDTLVAGRLILKGWKIAYVAEAQVFHSHDYTCREEFYRYRTVGELHAEHPWLFREFGGASGEGLRFVKSEIRLLAKSAPHLIPNAILRSVCKYLGYTLGRAERTRG